MNIGAHVYFQIMVFSRYMPRSEIAWSYSSTIFSFFRKFVLFSITGCTSLHSHQQCRRVPFSLYALRDLLLMDFFFLLITILAGVRLYLIVILICFSLLTSTLEHLFMCLLDICMSSLEKCLFRSSAHFFEWIVCFDAVKCNKLLDNF